MIGLRMMLVSGGEKDIVVDVVSIVQSGGVGAERLYGATVNFSEPVRENTQFTFEWYGRHTSGGSFSWKDKTYTVNKDAVSAVIESDILFYQRDDIYECRFKSADKPGYIRGLTGSFLRG